MTKILESIKVTGKKVALKYCGGCNPAFDRVEYYRKIQESARDSIEWVTPEKGGFDTVLLIEGCETACPEKDVDSFSGRRIVSIRNDDLEPEEVVKILLNEGKAN